MEIIVYHCSPDNIIEFDFGDGVHFGGLYSALEAGHRKVSIVDKEQDHVFLHTCKLTLSKYADVEDVGNYEEWLEQKQIHEKEGIYILRYKNKYEPDIQPSYFVLNKTSIQLMDVELLSVETVKEKLESCWQTGYL